jgi:hypothetical protein
MSDRAKDAPPASGTPELVLQQKAFRTKIDYRFFRDYVEYTIRDRNGALSCFTVKYSALPGRTEYGAYQPARRPVTGLQILLFALMILMISSAFPKASQWEIGLMVGGAVAALSISIALRWRFRNAYTTIPTAKGKLLLLRDKQHDLVLQELESRRMKELRKLATIDPLNSPQAELRKFEWLKEQEVITQEEFELIRQKLNVAAARLSFPGSTRKPPDEIVN